MSAPEPGDPLGSGAGGRRLLLRNDAAELSRLHAWLEDLAVAWGLAPDVTFAADLCLEEAVGNVIAYAFADGAPHEIRVSIARDGRRLVVEVEDDGRPFDPLVVPPPEVADRLEDVRIGGLGIHLIRRFASGTRYARDAGRNRLTLVIGPEEPGGAVEPRA